MSGVETVNQTETSITLRWNEIAKDATYILKYENNGSVEELVLFLSEPTVNYTVSNLSAGVNYTFALITVFQDVNSTGFAFHISTGESPAYNFIILRVKLSFPHLAVFTPSCLNLDRVVNKPHYDLHLIFNTNFLFFKFEWHALYFLGITTLFTAFCLFFSPSVPPMVARVTVTNRTVSSLTLYWDRQMDKGWTYILEINGTHHSSDNTTINNLEPGTKYWFSVTTEFSGLRSMPYENYTVTSVS